MATIMSVLGPITERDLGITLTHEHLFFDLSTWLQKPKLSSRLELEVTLSNFDAVHRAPFSSRDNLIFSNVRISITEVLRFKDAGGGTIVDLTTRGLKNNPRALKTVSQGTSVNVIAGTGFYINAPDPEIRVDEMVDIMVRDIRHGIDGTTIRAGLIGEIGCVGKEDGLTSGDKKRLTAAAKAQVETGAPLNIHPPLPMQGGEADPVLKLLEREGANLKRTTISHMDKPAALQHLAGTGKLSYIESVASYGVFIGFDGFGNEWPWTYDDFGTRIATDYERVLALKKLIGHGYLRRILLSHDTCNKIHLRQYGGSGYDHLLRDIVPLMKKEGISDEEIEILLVENPKSFLAP